MALSYGIFNDILGIRDETPSIKLQKAYMSSDSRWVYYDVNAIRRTKGRDNAFESKVTPDGNPIIRYHHHISVAGTNYHFAFTKANAYIWDSVSDEWDVMHTCASDCAYWSTASYNGKVIATNYVDKVQVWLDSTPGTAFTEMGSASGIDVDGANYLTKARFVFVYENYVHFLYTEEGGTTYAARDRWSSLGDETNFDENGAGDAGARDFTAGLWITGVGKYDAGGSSLMIIGTNKTIESQWLVEDTLVFEWQTHKHDLGCLSPDSMVQDALGNLYYLGTDLAFHRLLDDNPISDDIDYTVRNTHPTLRYYSRGFYSHTLNRLFWAIPSGGGASTNNVLMSYNLEIGMWDAQLTMSVSAFGTFTNDTAYTIDTIPYSTIDTIEWDTIDSAESVVGFLEDVVSDYDGNSYLFSKVTATDAGSTYTSKLVLGTDLSEGISLNQYKRIDGGFWVWFKKFNVSSRDVRIYYKNDETEDYTLVATVDTTVGYSDIVRTYCPADFRGRDFLIKIECDGDFAFYGIIFNYSFDGES